MRGAPVPTSIQENIDSVAQVEQRWSRQRSRADAVSDAVSAFAGSVRFVAAHAVAAGLWIAANLLLPGWLPLGLTLGILGVVASLEALFLSSFVLRSQNRQGRQVEHWAHVTLQLSMLAEQESTKTLQLLRRICDRLGLAEEAEDPHLEQLAQSTHVGALVEELAKARQVEEAQAAEEREGR